MIGPLVAVRVYRLDLRSAYDFYKRTLKLEPLSKAESVAIFETGQCKLVLQPVSPDDQEERALVGRFVGVSFAVDDAEAVYQELIKRGVAFDGAPERQPWGGFLAHFKDPDSNVLTLVETPGPTEKAKSSKSEDWKLAVSYDHLLGYSRKGWAREFQRRRAPIDELEE